MYLKEWLDVVGKKDKVIRLSIGAAVGQPSPFLRTNRHWTMLLQFGDGLISIVTFRSASSLPSVCWGNLLLVGKSELIHTLFLQWTVYKLFQGNENTKKINSRLAMLLKICKAISPGLSPSWAGIVVDTYLCLRVFCPGSLGHVTRKYSLTSRTVEAKG